jgi:hypothetical protein
MSRYNISLVAQAEHVCTGETAHDIHGVLNLYSFCNRVLRGDFDKRMCKSKPMEPMEKKFWLEMMPVYEEALEKIVASKGKVIPDTLPAWLAKRKKLNLK